jgi:hypothetical protein
MKATAKGVIGLDDSSSSEETPNSVAKTLRPVGKKHAKANKGKKTGDDDFKYTMEDLVQARKKAAEERKLSRNKESKNEQRRAVSKEKKEALEEKKVAMEENQQLVEYEETYFSWIHPT